jgi:RNA polymerase sigma factor (sigma-70 family)
VGFKSWSFSRTTEEMQGSGHKLRSVSGGKPPAEAAPESAAAAPSAEPAFDRMSPLVEAARRHEPEAVEELLGLLSQPLLRAVCALLGRDHPDVDDLVQDALIDVVSALPSFRGECTLLHFAIRIAARKAIATRRRALSVRGWLERFHVGEQPLRAPAPSPGEQLIADSRRRLLCELLAELPEAQAETVVLRALLGHSIEETAAITRAPVNTVRSRLRLAKEALRRRLENDPSSLELLDGA